MALLAIVALSAVLLSIVAMHASMARGHESASDGSVASATTMSMVSPALQANAGSTPDHAMSDMDLADCLLLGMVCFLAAAAVLTFALLVGRIRSLLRARAAAQSSGATLSRSRPPRPPSLLALSISRT